MRKLCCRLHKFKLLWFPWNQVEILISPPTCGHSYIHSFHQFKQNNPVERFHRKNRKLIKKEDVDRKIYTRDTVQEIYKLLKYSTWDSAQDQLRKLPIRWDSYTVNQVLKTHPPLEKAWLFFNWAAQLKGFKHDQFTYTTMLDIFGEAGRISSMNFVFKQMQEREIKIDVVTYTSLMHWISSSGDVDGAMKVWEEMKANDCNPTVVSYTAYMKILFSYNRVKEATDAYKEMLQLGLSPNCHTYTVLMEYLIRSGKCKEALEIFVKMQEAEVQPDKAACNILVEKLSQCGETGTMAQILHYMKENNIVLRYPVFVQACEALKVAGKSDFLLRQVNPHISTESTTKQSLRTTAADVLLNENEKLISILLKKENLVAVDCLLAGILNKNIKLDPVIVSTIIQVNCDCCRPDGALLAFDYSIKTGLNMSRNTYLGLIGILIRSNLFQKVVEVVAEMITAGHSVGIYLASILIHRLGCARRPNCAAKIFNLLPDDHKCTATYTALIGVYFPVGNADKALGIFRTMESKGVLPSLGTYDVLLEGLLRSGRVSEVETFRKEKKRVQAHGHFRDFVPIEERICDLIFIGNVVY
ncbi:hypothetical protein UlMin_001210 [Ulmus minor]